MTPRTIDALFIPYYCDIDRWHNDALDGDGRETSALAPTTDVSRRARMMREGVRIDGRLYDFSRFLSWVRYGSTIEYERYDSYTLTSLTGSYYLSFLRRHGIDVHVVNTANRHTLEALGHRYAPRFVLLSTTLLLEVLILREAIVHIRRVWPEAVLVLGGLFLVELQKTTSPDEFQNLLRDYQADVYVASPEGELPLLEILERGSLQALVENPDIPNTYIVSGDTVHMPSAMTDPPVAMAENYVRWNSVLPNDHVYHTVHTRTARSCAFKCSFCNFPINQGPLTLMPLEAVDQELQELENCGRIKSLIFTDDTFNVPLKRFKELCKILAKYDFEWYSFFRAQYADDETAQLMKEAHCKGVCLGIESADDEMLKIMDKVADIDTIKRGVEQLKNHDIRTHANFIIGFPGDTEEKSRKLVRFVDDMEIDCFTLSGWVYVPSTPIHRRREEFGLEGSWTNWKHNTMNSSEAWALAEQLLEEPKYSVYAPELAGAEFWSEIMLYCNGFTKDEARAVFRSYNVFRGKDTPAAEVKDSPAYGQLRAILERRPMPRPKNF